MAHTNQENKTPAADEATVLAWFAALPKPYNAVGKRVHELIIESVPDLKPRMWYGKPGYAKDGEVRIYFHLDDPYIALGFTQKMVPEPDEDDPGYLSPSAWVITSMDEATEKRLTKIVRRRAAG